MSTCYNLVDNLVVTLHHYFLHDHLHCIETNFNFLFFLQSLFVVVLEHAIQKYLVEMGR